MSSVARPVGSCTEDAELVSLRVGHDGPAEVLAPVVDEGCSEVQCAFDLFVSRGVLGGEVHVCAVLDGLGVGHAVEEDCVPVRAGQVALV